MIVDNYSLLNNTIYLGKCGEHGVRQANICIEPWVNDLGPGAATLVVKRSADEVPYEYELDVTSDGNAVIWAVSAVDTAFPGVGNVELFFYPMAGGLVKSRIFQTQTDPSMDDTAAEPEGFESWYAKLLKVKAETDAIKDQAAEAAGRAEAALADIPITVTDDETGTVTMTIGGGS